MYLSMLSQCRVTTYGAHGHLIELGAGGGGRGESESDVGDLHRDDANFQRVSIEEI